MRRDIELYISNRRVDLDDDSFILMNYTAEDADKPTAVLNSFSKQVTLPPTDTNKKLFKNMETADRITKGDGDDFNPLERTEFVIMIGGARFESGYCRMDYASPEEGYILTLFGGLGSFMYSLSYDDNGDTINLAKLDFLGGGDSTELDFIINKTNVQDAWTALKDGTPGKWQVVNFAPMYNGIPSDGFEADKGLIPLGSAGIPAMTEGYHGTRGTDGRYYALVNFTKEYSEWDMRDLRSYLQRPVLSINAFMTAIARPENNGGWTVDWADVSTLPEVMQGWLTLPMLRSEKKTQTVPSSTSHTTTVDYTRTTITPNPQTFPAGGSAEISVTFQPRFLGDFGSNSPQYLYFDGSIEPGTRPHGALFIQLVAYDSNNEAVGASDIAYVSSGSAYNPSSKNPFSGENLASICGFTPRYPGKAYSYIEAIVQKQSNNTYQLGKAITLRMQAYNARYFCLYIDFVHANWPWGGSVGSDARNLYATGSVFSEPYRYSTIQTHIITDLPNNPQVTYTTPSAARSDAKITKRILLNGTPTPAAVLTGLARTLGWKITSDYTSKTVRIVRRGTYYTGEVINIDKNIDRSQAYRLAPNFFQSRYLDFQTDMIESDFAAYYSGKYGRAYGSMRVDTNYKFNEEHLDMFDGVVLKQGITAQKLSSYFYTIVEKAVSKPAAFRDAGNTYTLWKDGDESAKEFEIPTLTNEAKITAINKTAEGYDDGRRLLMENDGKGISEGFGVLLYRQGQESVYAALSDDETVSELPDGKACWKPYFGTEQIDVPAFRTYLFSGDEIVTASDFGQPKELDIPAGTFRLDATIYERYWKDFVEDRYNVDAKVCTCFVRWEGIQVNNELLQKFFYFDNTLWSLNKISNYPVNSDDPCECEFIRVMNPEAYSQSYVPAKYINVNPTFILFPVEGGAQRIQVSTNAGPYTVNTEDEAPWITPNPRGGSHDATITLTASPNSTGGRRGGRVKIYSNSLNKTIYVDVRQESYYLRVRPLTARVPAAGETVKFQVESNAQWEVNCPDEDIVIMPDYGSGYGTVEVEVPENKYLQQRVITVNFTSDYAEGKQAVITQDFFQFNVTPRTLTMPKEGGRFFLDIETTADWRLVLPPAMLMNETTGTGDARVEISLRANTGDERELVIQARCTPVADQWDEEHPDPQEGEVNPGVIEVTVTQAGTPRLAVTPKSLDFNANGGTATLQVTANETFTWDAPAWLTITDVTPEPGPDDPPTFDKTLQVRIGANTSQNQRVTFINFVSASGLTVDVLVNQDAAEAPSLEVSPSTIPFEIPGSTENLNIYTTEQWTLSGLPSWVTADRNTGVGNDVVQLTAQPNNTGTSRSETITVTSGSGIVRTVTLTQEYPVARYITFRSEGANTLSLVPTGTPRALSLEYSNNGLDWTPWDYANDSLPFGNGTTLNIRGTNPNGISDSDITYHSFRITGDGGAYCGGNIMGLLNYTTDLASVPAFAFFGLFKGCTGLVSIANLSLPATSLARYCYGSMFEGCTDLDSAPEGLLPATTLAPQCYYRMFSDCTSMRFSPRLPATTLAEGCYYQMFYGCTSLTGLAGNILPASSVPSQAYNAMFAGCTSLTNAPQIASVLVGTYGMEAMFNGCSSLTAAPALPATSLGEGCYRNMFGGCTSLVTPPSLQALTLAANCYENMFYGCTALISAPALPATSLASYCYAGMFTRCEALVDAPALPAVNLATGCYSHMFVQCYSLVNAPVLPARTLVASCYEYMFEDCYMLQYIKMLGEDEFGQGYSDNWVQGLPQSTTGTFVKSANAQWTQSYGNDYIPQYWQIKTE